MASKNGSFCLYRFTNLVNGKKYIGQTTEDNPMQRYYKHIWEANNRGNYVIYRAIRKYGIENFSWEVIAECQNLDDLNYLEEYLINVQEDCLGEKGYNVKPGGRNTPHSEETKKKIGDGNRGLQKSHKGRKLTEEHRKAISEASMGKPGTNKGKKFDEEWKENMSAAMRAFSPEKEMEIALKYESGIETGILTKEYNCSHNTIAKIVERCGFKIREKGYNFQNRRRKFTEEEEKAIIDYYVRSNCSLGALGKQYHCRAETIEDLLLENNIHIRRKVKRSS